MDSAMIMVLVLCAGVVALLVWFEVNSRRNEASKTRVQLSPTAWRRYEERPDRG